MVISRGRWGVGVMVSTALVLATRPAALAQQPAAQQPAAERPVAPARDQVAPLAQLVAEAPTIAEVELAPDGSWVVYTVARGSVATNQYVTELWLQRLDPATGTPRGAPRLLVRRPRGDVPGAFTPRRCPDGRCLTVFLAAGDSGLTLRGAPAGRLPAEGAPAERAAAERAPTGGARLVRYDLVTGQATLVSVRDTAHLDAHSPRRARITAVGEDFEWSPRGNFLTFTAWLDAGPRLDPRRGVNVAPGGGWRGGPAGSNEGHNALFLLDVASGIVTQLTPDSLRVDACGCAVWAWAPDESAVVVVTIGTHDDGAFRPELTDLVVVNRVRRSVRPLVMQPGADWFPAWSPDGRWIAFTSSRGREGGREQGQHLAVIPAGGGPITYLQDEHAPSIGGSEKVWEPDSRGLLFTAAHRMNLWLYRAALPGTPSSGPSSLIGDMTTFFNDQFSFSADTRRVALVRSRGASPPELYVAGLAPSGLTQLRQITHLSDSFPLKDAVRVDTLSWPSRDGQLTVRGMLLTPATAWQQGKVAQPLPTLVDLKCGPPYAVLGCAFEELPLAARGYAVLVPQLRGNGGIEPARPLRDYMRTPNEDALAGLDLLIRRGIADSTRLGVFGLSQGGARTSGMITMTDRFKAAMVRESAYGTWEANLLRGAIRESNSPYWREHIAFSAERGDVYDPKDLARLIEESPALNLNRVRTPTLLLFGAHSEAPGSGKILFGGLQRFGVPSEFVVYDEGHGFYRPAAVVDYVSRTIAWFDYWLRDLPYPDPARQQAYDAWRQRRDGRATSQR